MHSHKDPPDDPPREIYVRMVDMNKQLDTRADALNALVDKIEIREKNPGASKLAKKLHKKRKKK